MHGPGVVSLPLDLPVPEKVESLSHQDEKAVQQLIDAFGPPLYRNDKGYPSRLNERFWSEFLAVERIMIFERDKRQFYLYNRTNRLYESLTPQVLKVHLSDLIKEADAN